MGDFSKQRIEEDIKKVKEELKKIDPNLFRFFDSIKHAKEVWEVLGKLKTEELNTIYYGAAQQGDVKHTGKINILFYVMKALHDLFKGSTAEAEKAKEVVKELSVYEKMLLEMEELKKIKRNETTSPVRAEKLSEQSKQFGKPQSKQQVSEKAPLVESKGFLRELNKVIEQKRSKNRCN